MVLLLALRFRLFCESLIFIISGSIFVGSSDRRRSRPTPWLIPRSQRDDCHIRMNRRIQIVWVLCMCVWKLRRPSSPDHFDRIIKRDCIRENVVNNIITSWFYSRLSCVYFIKSILWTYNNNTDKCWARVTVFLDNKYCFKKKNINFVFITEFIRVFSVWPAVK